MSQDISGTTRDTIEEEIVCEGFPLRLIDTAGLRESECRIEKEGVQRARTLVERADLVAYVVDASLPVQPEDQAMLQELEPEKALIVLNRRPGNAD